MNVIGCLCDNLLNDQLDGQHAPEDRANNVLKLFP